MTTLDPVDYWRLRALTAELERDQMQLALAQQRLERTRITRQDCWTALALQYHLDASKPYAARDADCALLDQAPTVEGAP